MYIIYIFLLAFKVSASCERGSRVFVSFFSWFAYPMLSSARETESGIAKQRLTPEPQRGDRDETRSNVGTQSRAKEPRERTATECAIPNTGTRPTTYRVIANFGFEKLPTKNFASPENFYLWGFHLSLAIRHGWKKVNIDIRMTNVIVRTFFFSGKNIIQYGIVLYYMILFTFMS